MLLLLSSLLLAPPVAVSHPVADSNRTVSGVSLPQTVDVGGKTLVLNGAALRKKAIFKVYVAALYLSGKSTNPDEILAADTPRQMAMHFLRGVDKKKICDAWTEGLKENTPNPSAELTSQFNHLCELMADLEKGQAMVFTYEPEIGITVQVAGVDKGVIESKVFADALLRCWLGPNPGPGEGFKKNLLGIS